MIAASTRNNNDNLHEYHERVVLPYQAVERLYDGLSEQGQVPDRSHITLAITMLESVLTTKNVPSEIRKRKLGGLLENKFLT